MAERSWVLGQQLWIFDSGLREEINWAQLLLPTIQTTEEKRQTTISYLEFG